MNAIHRFHDENYWLISDIPSTLHSLITGRLDRLETQTKRILQEASVIGRDFYYEMLKKLVNPD